jgi:hypothetical protein
MEASTTRGFHAKNGSKFKKYKLMLYRKLFVNQKAWFQRGDVTSSDKIFFSTIECQKRK